MQRKEQQEREREREREKKKRNRKRKRERAARERTAIQYGETRRTVALYQKVPATYIYAHAWFIYILTWFFTVRTRTRIHTYYTYIYIYIHLYIRIYPHLMFSFWLKFACLKGEIPMLVAVFLRKVGCELRQTWGFWDVICNNYWDLKQMGIIGNLKSPKCVCGWQWANVFFMFFPSRTKGTRFWLCLVFKHRVVKKSCWAMSDCLVYPRAWTYDVFGSPRPLFGRKQQRDPMEDPSILQGLEFPGSPFLQTEVLGQFSTQRGSKASSCDPR